MQIGLKKTKILPSQMIDKAFKTIKLALIKRLKCVIEINQAFFFLVQIGLSISKKTKLLQSQIIKIIL